MTEPSNMECEKDAISEGEEVIELDFLLMDFEPNTSEVKEIEEVYQDIVEEERIEQEVKSCLDNLLDKVEKELKSKKLFRKRTKKQSDWLISKRKRASESGLEHTNNKGKFIPTKKIRNKKDCKNSCKFQCSERIDKETQESIFNEVSQKMVYGVHEKKEENTGMLKPDGRGSKSFKTVSAEQKEDVINHINSFPVVDSHYCRAKTNKKYF